MIRLAVAGVGGLGAALVADVAQVPDLELEAIQDVDLERAREVAAQFHAARAVAEFDDLLQTDGLDAIAICTPNGMHAGQAQAALRAGKHVLVQKPLALTHRSACATLDIAALTGKVLFVDYTYRFLDTMRVLRANIDQPITAVSAVFHNIYGPGAHKTWFFDPRRSGGGALIDLGVHLLDLCLWLLAPTTADLANTALRGVGAVEDAATLDLICDGVPVQVAVSWNAELPETRIGLDCALQDGHHLRWENVAGSFFRFRTVRDTDLLLEAETTLRVDTLRAFVTAVNTGVAPAVDARVYALLDAAYAR